MRKRRTGPDVDELLASASQATADQLPKFTYTMRPNSATAGSTASTTLTVTNPSTVFPVAFSAGDTIFVSGWSGITKAPKAIDPVPPAGSDWGASIVDSSRGTILKLFVTDDIEVAPLASYAFTLNGIVIDDAVGDAQL